MQNPDLLIQFILYALFAEPAQLGYDPTVERQQSQDNTIDYIYTVDGTSYRTEGSPMSEDTAYSITSRATRVWRVREILGIVDGTETLSDDVYVLKDCWLYSDAKLQSEILEEIYGRLRIIDERQKTNHAQDAKPYFMDFKKDWHVELGGTRDTSFPCPPDVVRGAFTFVPQFITRNIARGTQRNVVPIGSPYVSGSPASAPMLQFQTRFHVRTVFKELCVTIDEVENYHTFFCALRDIVTGVVQLILVRL